MATRRRTITVNYSDAEAAAVHEYLLILRDESQDVTRKTQALHSLRVLFAEDAQPNHFKDAFRHLEGFQTLLKMTDRVSQTPSKPTALSSALDILHRSLLLLSTALQGHRGNGKYFRTRIENGGWNTLSKQLELLVDNLEAEDGVRVFESLFACAFNQEDLRFFNDKSSESHTTNFDKLLLHDPEAINVATKIWTKKQSPRSLAAVVNSIVNVSTHNLVAVHRTGILKTLLPLCLNSATPDIERLVLTLLELGLTDLDDAQFLYYNASTSPIIAKILCIGLKDPTPAYIHFDLSRHGFSSVELPNLGHFPPLGNSNGYTLSLWLNIVKFDAKAHTTIFGAYDDGHACFQMVYIEKDTRNLILQTSVTSSVTAQPPSVRFRSCRFEEARWYHVCLVHRRPKTTSSSRASLFIDGEFVEQAKIRYPSAPMTDSSGKHKPVQAFLGTPHDLAAQVGPKLNASQWRMGSALLIDDTLSDDLIAVHKQMGPRYYGNYQDCLGSFCTYQASAALNLRNENLHPGKDEQMKSEILAAIKGNAGALLPEGKILLNISPMALLDEDDRNTIDETNLIKSLSKVSTKNLRSVTRGGRTSIVINGAVPSINEALVHPRGYAILTGEPIVFIPQSLDDGAWRVGGCVPVSLSLIEAATGPEDIIRALDILIGTIHDNWRNSEGMERENGFGVLANLLAFKLGNVHTDQAHEELSFQILSRILSFVGYQKDRKEESIIENALAYRILLVDLDFWRSMSPKVQTLYYSQFRTFAVESIHRAFNLKRFARMRIVKKWLDALKAENFHVETFDCFIDAFRSLLEGQLSPDVLRALALYVTFASHKSKPYSILRSTKSVRQRPSMSPSNGLARRSTLASSPSRNGHIREMGCLQTGVRVLEVYADLLCHDETINIKYFATTVTNKWLLNLLADDEPSIIVLAVRILARVLVVNGPAYVEKFADKTGGFTIMRYRLKRWWKNTALWIACFAIFFGEDVSKIDLNEPFTLSNLMESFPKPKVVYPGVLPVIMGMLETGLRAITKGQETPTHAGENYMPPAMPTRSRATSLNGLNLPSNIGVDQKLAKTLQVATQFLANLHAKSQSFRDFTVSSTYVQELLFVLFPIIVSSDVVSAETEFNSRGSTLTFDGSDVIIRPHSQTSMKGTPIVRTTSVEPPSPNLSKAQPLKRGSSYILVTSEQSQHQPSSAKLHSVVTPGTQSFLVDISNSVVEEVLEIIIDVFVDQIFHRKDFPGIGLFMKVPPGFQEHQAYFESFILRNTLSHLQNTIQLNQKLLWEPKVLTNLARFATHLGEAVYEGWFIEGLEVVIDFLGNILEHLQRPDVLKLKSVRLCSEIITNIRTVLFRIILLRLSEIEGSPAFLDRLAYWQMIIFTKDTSGEFLKLFCYLLYTKVMSVSEQMRNAATSLWRILLVQKYDETLEILHEMMAVEDVYVALEFQKLLGLDNASFLSWVDDHRESLDKIFFGRMATTWEEFVGAENRKTDEGFKARILKRREKLKLWMADDLTNEDIIRRHEISSDHWRTNIYASEHLKRQRSVQDHQDAVNYNMLSWSTMKQRIHQAGGLFDDHLPPRWQLDQTEGRNRMRLRVIPDKDAHLHNYQAKGTSTPKSNALTLEIRQRNTPNRVPSPIAATPILNGNLLSGAAAALNEADDGFEMVDEPQDDSENYEDKNRKVMRTLQRGDKVEHVHNISRIVGLEACEGLLILGKKALYILDNFFQRSDGEIVNAWQAPSEERDSYLQMIAGRETGDRLKGNKTNHETRSWSWEDVLSISKRRFLFRDVAIEVFFVDGRSYLLTIASPQLRDELYQKLLLKAPSAQSGVSASPEDAWRIESLRTPEDAPQTLGSRFTNVFAHGSSNPTTRKWQKGEISNFHYLMLVNTMAGRTFNDLTQYPVFPWVIADYTSQELDLTDPRSFRDLSKPMGCQTLERQAEFRERYQSFAEMGDQPPFHYGTHYSSAMIVASYMIRMQPFVQSYLLLQGGSFDHPDRLFYSIEKAWISASRDNMTDVRELIPEFFYLPEFLVNTNAYDFGSRQGNGGTIDNVSLPPWAKGDPKIFIAKNREALESEYVSRNLHHWIDLVFGQKQRGEAALEATNVFHHLSYRGAKNLDEIDDPVERLATIGIIHNFGQTPHQVFQRSHPQREDPKSKQKKLDALADTLTRLPGHFLETKETIFSLQWNTRTSSPIFSNAFRLIIPPYYDKYMEWGFIDGSVRFYTADSRKLIGLFEHMHQGQLSCAVFADSRILITAGTDCTISVWSVITTPKTVDITPKACFFGNRSVVSTLAISRSFSTLVSVASDGQVMLWDLNALELVRIFTQGKHVECAQINDVNGTVMLCRGPEVALFTLNGDLLLEQHICVEGEDSMTSCSFYEGSGNEYLERDLILTGHRHGVVDIWNMNIHDGNYILEHVKRLNHMDMTGSNIKSTITCILPLADSVYTGDDEGRVYQWNCVQRQ